MLKKLSAWILLVASICTAGVVVAQGQSEEKKMSAEQFLASLHFQQGKINLPSGIASLNLSEKFRYLSPEDSEKVLVDAWGNPPGNKTLGMIFPANLSPLNEASWGVVITYDESGYVKDNDADSINYDDLLKDMKEQVAASSEERVKQGYGPMNLVGWAERPSYDKSTHKYYWAKEFSTNASENSLNYNIRVLGRKGVLVLNAVAGMKQINDIRQEMKSVVAFTDFEAGNRYSDFNADTDKVAEYGLAALVAGGVAAKLGFFGKLFAILLAAKKLLFVGIAALVAGASKFFKKKEQS